MRALGWGLPAERSAWSAIQFGGDGIEALPGVDGQVDALGEAPRQQVPVVETPENGGV
jgi:hypothetical protein